MARSLSAAPSRRPWFWSLLIALIWVIAFYAVAVLGWLGQSLLTPRGQITVYSVPKPAVLDRQNPAPESSHRPADGSTSPQEATDRMLAAIVPHGSQAWFFKVSGPTETVSKRAEAFATFISSVHFDGADSPPHWELPEGWEQQPGDQNRFSTLQIGAADEPLALSVTTLTKGEGDEAEYLLANVNRWRRQLSLPELRLADLAKELKEVKLEGATAYVVDLAGRMGTGGMGPAGMPRGPFSSGLPPFAGAEPPQGERPPPAAEGGEVSFKAPEGWTAGKAGGMRKASFVIEADGKMAEVTIIDLAAAANDVLTNVNRWRGQVKLGELKEADLATHVRDIDMGGVKGKYVELFAPPDAEPREAILGVVAYVNDKAWFIKLKGDATLAEREKKNFEAFARSIRFQKR